MKKYPFKFLDAYDKGDKAIFFGREQELEDLYRMVFQTNLLLLYGASGTGKTSLIRCGLANRFKASQWLDLYIRKGDDINQSLLQSIQNATPKKTEESIKNEGDDWFETLLDEEKTQTAATETPAIESQHPVAQALQELYLATFTPIYLIFDQFEELYTLGSEEEQHIFNATIAELVQLSLPIKIIIVMREEYLARLYALEKAVPQLRNKKLRIGPMDLPLVEQVILKATRDNSDSNIELEANQEVAIAKAIIEKIREGDVNIKLPYLQVFMDRLYEKTTGEAIDRTKAARFTLKLVQQLGTIGDVLADFIELQSQRIHQKLATSYTGLPTDIVWQVLSPFATFNGTKIPIKQVELAKLEQQIPNIAADQKTAIVKACITELENSRILRFRKEENSYEVAHDSLAKQIAEKRSEEEKAYLKARRLVQESYASYQDTRTYLSREQLVFIQPYLSRLTQDIPEPQQNFIKASQKTRNRQRLLLWSGVAAAFAIAIAVIFTISNAQRKTQKALDDFTTEQAKRELGELNKLLENITQIASTKDCPPNEMITTIDSLFKKQPPNPDLSTRFQNTKQKIRHCDENQ